MGRTKSPQKLAGWISTNKSIPNVSIVFENGAKVVCQKTIFQLNHVAFTSLSKEELSILSNVVECLNNVITNYDSIVQQCNVD